MKKFLSRSRDCLLAAMLLAMSVACGTASPPERGGDRAASSAGPVPDRILVKPEFRVVVGGMRYALVEADSMYVNEDSTSARLFGLHLQLLDTLGGRIADVRSTGAHYNLRTQVLLAQGSAVLIGPASGRIETEALHVDPAAHRIWSDAQASVQWAGGGAGVFDSFTVDDRFRNFKGTNPKGPARGGL